MIVVDVQGVGDLYTDPQIHTASEDEYGEANLGQLERFNVCPVSICSFNAWNTFYEIALFAEKVMFPQFPKCLLGFY